MLKTVLILIVSIAWSTKISDTSDNFDDLQAFLQSFMNSYTGREYPMAACLTPQIQATLNQKLAASYGYILTLDYEGLLDSYEQFLYTLGISCELCGLNQVQVSLANGLDEKSEFWYQVNLIFNSKRVYSLFESFGAKFKSNDWAGAGSILGQITGILIPFEQIKLNSSLAAMNTQAYLDFWKGLVSGLMSNPRKQGICSTFLLKFANNTIQPAVDINKILEGDNSGFLTVFGDLATALSFGKSGYTGGCNFELLDENLKQLITKEGLQTVGIRYLSNLPSVDAAIQNVKNCDEHIFSCGQGTGQLIRYLVGWSIQ